MDTQVALGNAKLEHRLLSIRKSRLLLDRINEALTVLRHKPGNGELMYTQQPDQLVLQLGTRWAGVEFELRTDAGVFPAPIIVDETGVLTMDLGGSTTYTLSCINSTVPIPDPPAEQVPDTQQPPDSSAQQPSGQVQQPQEQVPAVEPADVPIAPMVVFFVGLACGIGGLVALYFAKRRRQQADYDEWAEEDEEQY